MMADKKKVLLDTSFRTVEMIFTPEDLDRLYTICDVVWGRDKPMPPEEYELIKSELFAIVCGSWRHGAVAELPSLKAILEVGGRHPSPKILDYDSCFARNIRVLSCAPAFGPMVAEMALGMTLAASRDIIGGHNAFRAGEEVYSYRGNVNTFTLFDRTVGFIGYGGLARNLQPLLRPFRCHILAHDPWLPRTHLAKQGVEPVELEDLLERSEVIYVLAIPSASNQALLDRAMLERIQPNAVLVLISRAHLVDFDALTELLLEGRFKAAIDVFPQEPLDKDHAIRRAPGVVLSAHRAGSVSRDLRLIGRMVVDDLETMIAGLPPTEMQVAQPEIIYRLD
jgi:phosphoglycerate dehydrogenase-like enzyme